MVWSKSELLDELALSRRDARGGRRSSIYIDKAEIDERSRGALALISETTLDPTTGLKELDLRAWAIHPTGRAECQHLFQIETESLPNDHIDIKGLWVLGREVNLHDTKGVANTLEAIRQVHVGLRDPSGKLPNVAQIFKDCRLEEIVGETLPLVGFDIKHGIHFPVSPVFNQAALGNEKPKLLLPYETIRPLCGARTNTLDLERSYMNHDFLKVRAVPNPHVAQVFEMKSRIDKDKNGLQTLNLSQKPVGGEESHTASVQWKPIKPTNDNGLKHKMAEISLLEIFTHNVLHDGRNAAMNAFGVLNRTNAELLESRDYPHLQDHLASFGLLDVANSSSGKPPKDGRFVVTSEGGNNLREIVEGVGEDIGGNCKTAETQWLDPITMQIKKIGVILDFGSYLIRQKSEWTGAVPDVVEKLAYCKDICITHHHLDHLDAIVPYVERGLIGQCHTLHLTREVAEMAKDKLTKMGVAKHKYPKFSILNGTDALDLKDDNGVIRMTVMHGADAVPHSARCTPFTVYGRNGDDILGSYTYLGDMRYEDEWFALHDSPFWNPVKFMSEREPQLNKKHLLPTYSEIDLTSVKREGRSPSEKQVEDNLTHVLKNWLHDRHVGVPMIGTADGRRETLLRVANRAERKVTAFGAAVEFIFRIANKHGVNPYRLDRPEEGKYTGLKDYLSWHAEENGIAPTIFKSRTSKTVKDWFKNDRAGTILAVMSGSQGNPIEFESMTYKLADRRSFFDANPKHSKTARPADLKDWAIVFTQGAIPGNSAYQRKLIAKLADRGATVLEAFGDNIRIHRPNGLQDRILNDLKTLEREAEIEADGSILIADMPIHASGHGRRGDMRLWLGKLQSKLYGGHHTDDQETVNVAYDTIMEEGKKHPGKIFQNYEQVQITNDDAVVIGRSLPSVVMTRELAEDGKHYNKRLEATRMMVFDDRSPHNDLGLRCKTNGAFEIHFGVEDAEDVKRRIKNTAKDNKDDHDLETKPFRFGQGMARLPTPPWQPPNMGG